MAARRRVMVFERRHLGNHRHPVMDKGDERVIQRVNLCAQRLKRWRSISLFFLGLHGK